MLDRRHAYYHQVQLQCYCWDSKHGDFFLSLGSGPDQQFYERIPFDRAGFEKDTLPKLQRFYFNLMLPELAAPRAPRGLAPRVPVTR